MKQVMNHNKDNGLLNMIRRTDTMISKVKRGYAKLWQRFRKSEFLVSFSFHLIYICLVNKGIGIVYIE